MKRATVGVLLLVAAMLAETVPAATAAAEAAPNPEEVAYEGGRFVLVRSQDGTCVIALQGLVTTDASFKFEDVVRRTVGSGCKEPWLLLESPGGLLNEGLWIGREVRLQGFRTITRQDCASACSIIFLSGTERVLLGPLARIGLHQPATVRSAGNERWCASSMDSNGVHQVRSYLEWAISATADRVMDLIMHTPCDAIDWVHGQRALDLGIATRLQSETAGGFGR